MGGAERSLLLMAKYLCSEFCISVACPVASDLSRNLASLGISCHRLPRPPKVACSSVLASWYWLTTSCVLAAIAFRVKPDLIHANSTYAGFASLLTSLVTRTKLVLHARDLNRFGFLSRCFGVSCEAIIAVSHAVRILLVGHHVRPDKIKVVYNGVDNSASAADCAKEHSFGGSASEGRRTFTFAQVGQLVPWKNHAVFLQAACRVAKALPGARFVLVGDDIFGRDCRYKRRLLSQIENSQIAERVVFLGWQENMDGIWRGIDCLVHTAEREPFGRVIIEAMAHKVPVIAVKTCGPKEIIRNGRTGILVRADDAEGLSAAMLKLAQDTQYTKSLVTAGHECVMSQFTAEKTAGAVKEIYREILAVRNSANGVCSSERSEESLVL